MSVPFGTLAQMAFTIVRSSRAGSGTSSASFFGMSTTIEQGEMLEHTTHPSTPGSQLPIRDFGPNPVGTKASCLQTASHKKPKNDRKVFLPPLGTVTTMTLHRGRS